MEGMSAVAHRTQAVTCWDADRAREVAVRPAAGRTFLEVIAERVGNPPRLAVQTRHAAGPFQRRPVEAAGDLQPGCRMTGRQGADPGVSELHLVPAGRA